MNKDFYLHQGPVLGNAICSTLSLLGSIFVILSFILIETLRSITFYLIFSISIAELLNSIAHIFSIRTYWVYDDYYSKSFLCDAQRVIIVITDTCMLMILSLIGYNIYRLVIKNDRELISKKTLFIILGPSIGIILSGLILLPFYLVRPNKVQNDSLYTNWCWVRFQTSRDTSKQKEKYMNLSFIIISIIYSYIIGYIIVTILRVIIFIKRKKQSKENSPAFDKVSLICQKLYYYIYIGTFWWLVSIVNFFFPYKLQETYDYEFSDLEEFNNRFKFIILAIMGMITCTRGFFISVVFYSNSKVKEEVNGFLKKAVEALLIRKGLYADSHDINAQSINSKDTNVISGKILDDSD